MIGIHVYSGPSKRPSHTEKWHHTTAIGEGHSDKNPEGIKRPEWSIIGESVEEIWGV